jgi:hypothetical protein
MARRSRCLPGSRLSGDPAKRVLLAEASRKEKSGWINIPVRYLYCIIVSLNGLLFSADLQRILRNRFNTASIQYCFPGWGGKDWFSHPHRLVFIASVSGRDRATCLYWVTIRAVSFWMSWMNLALLS